MKGETRATLQPITYPARPINGGSLELAPAKSGNWYYEPKYNGWRALVHAPTGTMFNRYGGLLSIAELFAVPLQKLARTKVSVKGRPVEWFDCEALGRRHALGQGTLLVFDCVVPGEANRTLSQRKAILTEAFVGHDYTRPALKQELYVVCGYDQTSKAPAEFYRELKQLNATWRCGFYEGVIAKRTGDRYPVQLRSAHEEFVGWVKHRWAY